MKYSNLTIDETIKLQEKYRKGLISQSQIPEDELMDLKLLYNEQINYLKKSINKDKQEILKIFKKYGIKK